jgi:hypothetical protein
MSAVLENLTKGLQEAGKKNFDVEDSSEAMANLAKPIAEAIDEKDVPTIANWQGIATVEQLNEMTSQQKNDGWNIAGSGTIVNPDGSQIEVTDGDGVMWNGSKWNLVIDINIQSISDDFINNLN